MKRISMMSGWLLVAPLMPFARGEEKPNPKETQAVSPKSVYDFTVKDIVGKDVPLSRFNGNVMLIVNVASR